MSKSLEQVQALVAAGAVRISLHGYEELALDSISVREVINGLGVAVVVEDYPDYPKGPCVLVLEKDRNNHPIHIVWGIPEGKSSPTVLITGYRPDPERWDETWQRRLR